MIRKRIRHVWNAESERVVVVVVELSNKLDIWFQFGHLKKWIKRQKKLFNEWNAEDDPVSLFKTIIKVAVVVVVVMVVVFERKRRRDELLNGQKMTKLLNKKLIRQTCCLLKINGWWSG